MLGGWMARPPRRPRGQHHHQDLLLLHLSNRLDICSGEAGRVPRTFPPGFFWGWIALCGGEELPRGALLWCDHGLLSQGQLSPQEGVSGTWTMVPLQVCP